MSSLRFDPIVDTTLSSFPTLTHHQMTKRLALCGYDTFLRDRALGAYDKSCTPRPAPPTSATPRTTMVPLGARRRKPPPVRVLPSRVTPEGSSSCPGRIFLPKTAFPPPRQQWAGYEPSTAYYPRREPAALGPRAQSKLAMRLSTPRAAPTPTPQVAPRVIRSARRIDEWVAGATRPR